MRTVRIGEQVFYAYELRNALTAEEAKVIFRNLARPSAIQVVCPFARLPNANPVASMCNFMSLGGGRCIAFQGALMHHSENPQMQELFAAIFYLYAGFLLEELAKRINGHSNSVSVTPTAPSASH